MAAVELTCWRSKVDKLALPATCTHLRLFGDIRFKCKISTKTKANVNTNTNVNTQTNTKQIQAQINTKVKIVAASHLCPYTWLFGDLKQFTNTIQAETKKKMRQSFIAMQTPLKYQG